MQRIFKNIIVLISIIYLCGCASSDMAETKFEKSPDNLENIKTLDIGKEDNTLSYGIVNDQGIVETNVVYQVKKGESFNRFISINNYLGFDSEFTVLFFDNYVQSSFAVEAEKGNQYTINVKNKEAVYIPIEIANLNEGYHDIIFLIAIPNTSGERGQEERFMASEPVYLRCTIMIDDNSFQKEKVIEFARSESQNEGLYLGSNINGTQESETKKVATGEETNLYITVDRGKESKKNRNDDCVVIVLKDLEQIDVLERPFIYTKVQVDNRIIVPIKLRTNELGYSEYMAILVNRPYTIIDRYEAFEDITYSSYYGIKVN